MDPADPETSHVGATRRLPATPRGGPTFCVFGRIFAIGPSKGCAFCCHIETPISCRARVQVGPVRCDCYAWGASFRAHFSFWTGCRGGRPRRSMPTLIAPESLQSVQTQQGFIPGWTPKLPRALEPALILRAGCLYRPAAQRFLPLLRTPILPPLLVLLQMDHPAGPPFPRLLRPSCSSSPKRPCFHPWR